MCFLQAIFLADATFSVKKISGRNMSRPTLFPKLINRLLHDVCEGEGKNRRFFPSPSHTSCNKRFIVHEYELILARNLSYGFTFDGNLTGREKPSDFQSFMDGEIVDDGTHDSS